MFYIFTFSYQHLTLDIKKANNSSVNTQQLQSLLLKSGTFIKQIYL